MIINVLQNASRYKLLTLANTRKNQQNELKHYYIDIYLCFVFIYSNPPHPLLIKKIFNKDKSIILTYNPPNQSHPHPSIQPQYLQIKTIILVVVRISQELHN